MEWELQLLVTVLVAVIIAQWFYYRRKMAESDAEIIDLYAQLQDSCIELTDCKKKQREQAQEIEKLKRNNS